jgi:hypothetical protein
LTSQPNPPRPHRISNIFEGLLSHIITGNLDLAPDLPIGIIGHADPARFGDALKARSNINPIAKDIVVFNDNITDVNADAKFNPLDLRYIDIVFGHAALNFDRAAYGIYDAAELDESAVPGILDDVILGSKSVLLRAFSCASVPSSSIPIKRQEPATSAARIAASRRSTCSLLKRHPPKLGEIEISYIAEL